MTAIQPTKATLKKYGLSVSEWETLLTRQNGTCAICHRLPKSLRLHIDHKHIKGWKKLLPDIRKTYVRGLLCMICNRFIVGKHLTVEKALDAASYLKAYEDK